MVHSCTKSRPKRNTTQRREPRRFIPDRTRTENRQSPQHPEMDPTRGPRAVSDPMVRHVGFFAPEVLADQPHSGPPDPDSSPPVSGISPCSNSLSPVMIPPPRNSRHDPTYSPLRAARANEQSLLVGSYNPSEFLSPSIDMDFSDDPVSPGSLPGGKFERFAASLPSNRRDVEVAKKITVVNLPHCVPVPDGRANAEKQKEKSADGGKSLKEKTTKAERRAIQEAQRAAKAAAKGEGSKASSVTGVLPTSKGRPVKTAPQKKENSPAVASEKKSVDHRPDKDRKKDAPPPRMQFDDETKVEKAKKRAVVKQRAARHIVELFRHLPQYEHEKRIPDLESKFFQLQRVHPAVYTVGLRYLAGDVSGGIARCVSMLQAFQESIMDYSTPPEKALIRDLSTKINAYVSFLIECRPLSISMGNAIRFLKSRIANLPLDLSESEAKASLISDIDRFISEKIILAEKVIVKHAVTKIRNGDVLLTYGASFVVEMLLLHAHELGKKFSVIIVDSHPHFEGRLLLHRLVGKGISCTYTHINALSYVFHEVTRVFLGASSVLCNGTVYSKAGTACVAMVAHNFRVPVLICCEAYKFHERVQLDSICSNELGDPDAVARVLGRKEINFLDGWSNTENLQILNLIYDATPSDYVSAIITDYGMIPPTSVPVIVREYRRENLWV